MEYFDCTAPSGNGLCSDNNCPCPDVVIPHGQGYLFISKDLVDFRSKYRSEEEANMAMRAKLAAKHVMMGRGGFNVRMLYSISPILVCEQGAKLRKLDLKVAGKDAAHWWKTGKVPLRPTPTLESVVIDQESSRSKRQQYVTNEKLLTDATQQNDISVEETFNSLLMDIMCCMMCADQTINEKEIRTICSILKELKIPWDRREVERRFRDFIEQVRLRGISCIIEQTLNQIKESNWFDEGRQMLDCMDRVLRADDFVDPRETEVLQKFRAAINCALPTTQDYDIESEMSSWADSDRSVRLQTPPPKPYHRQPTTSGPPNGIISSKPNAFPKKENNRRFHKRSIGNSTSDNCYKCGHKHKKHLSVPDLSFIDRLPRFVQSRFLMREEENFYCKECGIVCCLACAKFIERFGAPWPACPACGQKLDNLFYRDLDLG